MEINLFYNWWDFSAKILFSNCNYPVRYSSRWLHSPNYMVDRLLDSFLILRHWFYMLVNFISLDWTSAVCMIYFIYALFVCLLKCIVITCVIMFNCMVLSFLQQSDDQTIDISWDSWAWLVQCCHVSHGHYKGLCMETAKLCSWWTHTHTIG